MFFKFSIILVALLLTACNQPQEQDDIPAVDDPHNIIIDGKLVKPMEFNDRYCRAKPEHKSCLAVQKAIHYDSLHGKMPAGY